MTIYFSEKSAHSPNADLNQSNSSFNEDLSIWHKYIAFENAKKFSGKNYATLSNMQIQIQN